MVEQLSSLAQLLNLPPGGLIKLAADISHRPHIQSVRLLTRTERLNLYFFLYDCAVSQGHLPRKMAA